MLGTIALNQRLYLKIDEASPNPPTVHSAKTTQVWTLPSWALWAIDIYLELGSGDSEVLYMTNGESVSAVNHDVSSHFYILKLLTKKSYLGN